MANLKKLLVAALKEQMVSDKPVRLPAGGDMLWHWFHNLSATRTLHAAGANPIQFGEIAAYFRLRQIVPEQHHIDILLAMDQAFLDHVHAASKPLPEGVKALPPISKRPISTELFDAMIG